MVREEQLRLLKGLINHLDNKTNVNAGGILKTPADTYISEDRFKKEWNSFFFGSQKYKVEGNLVIDETRKGCEDWSAQHAFAPKKIEHKPHENLLKDMR